MYGGGETEQRRLDALNNSHNPETLRFLQPLIPGKKRILEIGCGQGQLAKSVAAKMDSDAKLVAIDKDLHQVSASGTTLSKTDRVEVTQVDIMNTTALAELGKFDLIYCRWVICHIPSERRIPVIAALLQMLNIGGVFLMDECDNSTVKFYSKTSTAVPDHAEQATSLFTQVYDAIGSKRGIDLKMKADESRVLVENASRAAKLEGTAKHEGSYCIQLDTVEKKRMVTDGKRSCSSAIFDATGKKPEEVIGIYEQVEKDDDIVGDFLTENITTFTRSA